MKRKGCSFSKIQKFFKIFKKIFERPPPHSNCLTYIPNDVLTKQEKDTPASP